MLTRDGCRARQQRLLQRMNEARIDAIALVHPLEIYYFTGVLLPEQFPAQPALLWIEAGWRRTVMRGNHWWTRATPTRAASAGP